MRSIIFCFYGIEQGLVTAVSLPRPVHQRAGSSDHHPASGRHILIQVSPGALGEKSPLYGSKVRDMVRHLMYRRLDTRHEIVRWFDRPEPS